MAKTPSAPSALVNQRAWSPVDSGALTIRKIREKAIEFAMFLCALSSIAITVGIVGILVLESWHFFQHVALREFLTDTQWTVLFENPRYGARDLIQHPPSEYLRSGRIFFGCEGNEPFLPRIVGELGDDLLMFSSDYPHADRTLGTARFLRDRTDMSAALRRKLLEENARRFYGV